MNAIEYGKNFFLISTLILRSECPLKIASLISSNTSNRSLVCKKVKMLINDWASYDIMHYLPWFVICSYHSKNWGNNNIHHRRIGWKRERRILQVSVHPIKHRIRKVPAVSCDTFQHSKSPLLPPKKKHYIVYFSASQSASQLSLYYRLEYIDRSSESMKVMTPTITFGFSDFQGARERELPPPGSYFKHVPHVGWFIY